MYMDVQHILLTLSDSERYWNLRPENSDFTI